MRVDTARRATAHHAKVVLRNHARCRREEHMLVHCGSATRGDRQLGIKSQEGLDGLGRLLVHRERASGVQTLTRVATHLARR